MDRRFSRNLIYYIGGQGCPSLPVASPAATKARAALSNTPKLRKPIRDGRPPVSVPVLTNTAWSTRGRVAREAPRRNRMPKGQRRDQIAMGMTSPMAQGKAISRTLTAKTKAWLRRPGTGTQPNQEGSAEVHATQPVASGDARSRWLGRACTTAQFLSPPNILIGLGIMPIGFEPPESRPLWPP